MFTRAFDLTMVACWRHPALRKRRTRSKDRLKHQDYEAGDKARHPPTILFAGDRSFFAGKRSTTAGYIINRGIDSFQLPDLITSLPGASLPPSSSCCTWEERRPQRAHA
jgi:hypothetical protein